MGARLVPGRDLVGSTVAAADWLRRGTLRALLPTGKPAARKWLIDRELRVGLLGASSIFLSLLATFLCPVALLVIAPLVLGIPHVLADIRYLVLRPGLHRRTLLAAMGGVPILLGVAFSYGVRGGLFGALAALVVVRAPLMRRIAVGLPVVILFVAACLFSRAADLLFLHLHNLVAVLFFVVWRPRKRSIHWAFLFLFCAGSAAVLLAGERFVMSAAMLAPWAYVYAPFASDVLALRIVLCFIFAQSVHYAVWLRLIPEEARPSPSPHSFGQSLRSWKKEVGAGLLVLAALLTMCLLVLALSDGADAARSVYLRMATFHGQLELVAGTLLLTEGRRP